MRKNNLDPDTVNDSVCPGSLGGPGGEEADDVDGVVHLLLHHQDLAQRVQLTIYSFF